MSPAGILFHEGIRDCGATVVVAGTGNTDLQIQIMRDLKVTGFCGHAQLFNDRYQAGGGDWAITLKKDLFIKARLVHRRNAAAFAAQDF